MTTLSFILMESYRSPCEDRKATSDGVCQSTYRVHSSDCWGIEYQKTEGRGCHKIFAKGSGLLLHFEQNACRPLQSFTTADRIIPAKEMLEQDRALLAMQMEDI